MRKSISQEFYKNLAILTSFSWFFSLSLSIISLDQWKWPPWNLDNLPSGSPHLGPSGPDWRHGSDNLLSGSPHPRPLVPDRRHRSDNLPSGSRHRSPQFLDQRHESDNLPSGSRHPRPSGPDRRHGFLSVVPSEDGRNSGAQGRRVWHPLETVKTHT